MGDAGVANVVTTNGITYAEYSWAVGGCYELDSMGPLTRNGNNFSFDFDIEQYTGACPLYLIEEHTNVVLGVLAPGTYTLTTTSWGVPVRTNTFTVWTTLQTIGFAADGSFQIQLLNCVTNASYVLQCSTNLVNWTSLSTNSVGQPLRDPSPVLPGPCYYRVQMLQQ